MSARTVVYVTSNTHKVEEIELLRQEGTFPDGKPLKEIFKIETREVSIPERLEIDLEVMVRHEVIRAYEVLKVPCIVEHAGLIYDGLEKANFPGGLTKPMWNALGSDLVSRTNAVDAGVTAKAVVVYCDGMRIHSFTGSTHGRLTIVPAGDRSFYWDTIFIPDDPARPNSELTYAAIVEHPALGLRHKVLHLSQSAKAMIACLQFIRENPLNALWA